MAETGACWFTCGAGGGRCDGICPPRPHPNPVHHPHLTSALPPLLSCKSHPGRPSPLSFHPCIVQVPVLPSPSSIPCTCPFTPCISILSLTSLRRLLIFRPWGLIIDNVLFLSLHSQPLLTVSVLCLIHYSCVVGQYRNIRLKEIIHPKFHNSSPYFTVLLYQEPTATT